MLTAFPTRTGAPTGPPPSINPVFPW